MESERARGAQPGLSVFIEQNTDREGEGAMARNHWRSSSSSRIDARQGAAAPLVCPHQMWACSGPLWMAASNSSLGEIVVGASLGFKILL